jgi:hypothetical protein
MHAISGFGIKLVIARKGLSGSEIQSVKWFYKILRPAFLFNARRIESEK